MRIVAPGGRGFLVDAIEIDEPNAGQGSHIGIDVARKPEIDAEQWTRVGFAGACEHCGIDDGRRRARARDDHVGDRERLVELLPPPRLDTVLLRELERSIVRAVHERHAHVWNCTERPKCRARSVAGAEYEDVSLL